MKIGLMNLKSKLQNLNLSGFFLKPGGWEVDNVALSLFYLSIFIFNVILQLFMMDNAFKNIMLTLPFILISVLFITKLKKSVDLIIDTFIFISLLVVAPEGTFSAIAFLYIILFRITNKEHYKIIITLGLMGFLANSLTMNLKITQIFLYGILFSLVGFKYYYIIHKPTEKLKQTIIDQSTTISDLKRKLSILGSPKGLSNEQILELYPFMSHTSDHPYRKIHDLILLTEGKVYKEIADINNIKNISTVSDQFAKMREAVGKVTNRDIPNNPSLIFVCVELNILKLNYRYVENI